MLVTAVNSVGSVMLPRLSYYQARRKERQAGELIAKNMNFVMVFGSAIIALLILLATRSWHCSVALTSRNPRFRYDSSVLR